MDHITQQHENIFRVTGLLLGGSPVAGGPLHNGDAEFWCFLWYAPEQTVEQPIATPEIWDAIALIMTSL